MILPLIDLIVLGQDKRKLIDYLHENHFIQMLRSCSNGHELILMKLSNRSDILDGVCLQCPRCNRGKSIRAGSFFENKNLDLLKVLIIFHSFEAKLTASECSSLFNLRRRTVSTYYKKIREMIEADLEAFPIDFAVEGLWEIDETFIGHVLDTTTNEYVERQWVFGLTNRNTGETFLTLVEDRTQETLLPEILTHIPPGSVVFSDELPSYRILEEFYRHYTVNHGKKEYAREENIEGFGPTLVHTNNIEGIWKHFRALLRNKKVRIKKFLHLYTSELMFRMDGRKIFDLIRLF